MFHDQIGVINKILDFLKLPPLKKEIYELLVNSNKRNNVSKNLIVMLNETKEILEDFFRPMNRKLTDLLQLKDTLW